MSWCCLCGCPDAAESNAGTLASYKGGHAHRVGHCKTSAQWPISAPGLANHHLSPSHSTWVTLQLLWSADPPARVRAGETCTYTSVPSSIRKVSSNGRRRYGRYPRQPPLDNHQGGGIRESRSRLRLGRRTGIGTAFIPAPKGRSPAHCTASLQRASLPPSGRPRAVPHLSPLS
jgi:hypothetical protein